MSAETSASTAAGPATREVHMTLEEVLAHSVARHQAGDLDQAEAIYGAVLQRHPDRTDVLNWLGILKHQQGDLEAAAALLRRVVELEPTADGVWNNLARALRAPRRACACRVRGGRPAGRRTGGGGAARGRPGAGARLAGDGAPARLSVAAAS